MKQRTTMQINIRTALGFQASDESNWLPNYPNPADFRFDYARIAAVEVRATSVTLHPLGHRNDTGLDAPEIIAPFHAAAPSDRSWRAFIRAPIHRVTEQQSHEAITRLNANQTTYLMHSHGVE
jgi:hypothetical protein